MARRDIDWNVKRTDHRNRPSNGSHRKVRFSFRIKQRVYIDIKLTDNYCLSMVENQSKSQKGITIESEYLDVDKYRTANIDSYECVADNGVGEPLRKAVKVSFMGK